MNLRNAALVVDESLTTVLCRFNSGDMDYMFVCTKELAATLSVDDFVVAETTKGLSVVRVICIHNDTEIDPNNSLKYQFIVQRVNIEVLDDMNAKLNDSVTKLQQLQRDTMRERVRAEIKAGTLLDHKGDD